MTTDKDIEERLETEAAGWFTAMHSGEVDRDMREAFEAWLHTDRAHKIAYREFEQVYRDLAHVAVESGLDLDEALGRNRRGWRALVPEWIGKPALAGGSRLSGLAGVAALVGALVLVLVLFADVGPSIRAPEIAASPEYATRVAEIKEFTLEDGTHITLGASSEIKTDFTPAVRKVTLLEGEAFFEVAKDPNRPFFVAAQDTLVRVVGTKFDVKRSADIVHVSVLEGVVEVMKPDNLEKAIETGDTGGADKQVLTAGERVSAARRVALPEAQQVDQAPPGAWRKGRLAYEDASLAEIVADLNRYYPRPIRILSPDVGDLRSTVAFQIAEVGQVFDVLEAIQPVEVDQSDPREIVIRKRR